MSDQQNHNSHEEAAQVHVLAGLVRLLARFAVEDFLATAPHKKSSEIPQFVPRQDNCACSASALPPAYRKEVK